MLVLSRRSNEKIYIGDDIEIHILCTKDRDVKVGIVAPKHVQILRSEVKKRIDKQLALASVENQQD